ncbi:MAG: glycosyltransferase family 2 protein [Planctomycetes bacterium]|nr:glycosyltransferase family 2 protein [Planctomycetota bacterium]
MVIVNYCQWRNTAQLTKQLRRSDAAKAGEAEIVIVDNHSPNHPLRSRLRRLDGVSLRRFSRNRGFAKAVNEGCRLSRGEWFLLLNPDMTVPAGFLDTVDDLIRDLDRQHPNAGVIGLGVRDADGSRQPSCGAIPTLGGTLLGLLRPRSRRKCQESRETRAEVPWATGCALLIRRDCLQQIGGFDEDFFLYYEDVDFCRRAAENGWKVLFEPSVQVFHHTPLHKRNVTAALRLMTRHALLTFARKHWSSWRVRILGGIIGFESIVRQAASGWRGQTSDMEMHGQIRQMVGDVLADRDANVRARIRDAAETLRLSSSIQDGVTC